MCERHGALPRCVRMCSGGGGLSDRGEEVFLTVGMGSCTFERVTSRRRHNTTLASRPRRNGVVATRRVVVVTDRAEVLFFLFLLSLLLPPRDFGPRAWWVVRRGVSLHVRIRNARVGLVAILLSSRTFLCVVVVATQRKQENMTNARRWLHAR